MFKGPRYSVVVSATKQKIANGRPYQPLAAPPADNISKGWANVLFEQAMKDDDYRDGVELGVTRVSLVDAYPARRYRHAAGGAR